ncbi:MAG: hypothetical protein IT361_01965 [Gemmatimonadaceae bacterium]|nr:hypothetical protein [Gemmatimonadaceae bacterium]
MSPRFAFTPLPPSRSDARRPSALAALAGTWRGNMVDQAGHRESMTLIRDTTSDAAVAGRFLFFVTRDVAPTGVRLLEASNTSFVAMIGPYFDPRESGDVVTVLEGHRTGDRIEGTFYTRLHGCRDTLREGTFSASRSGSTHRAA